MIEELQEYFDTMEEQYGIQPSETAEQTGRNLAHLGPDPDNGDK